MNATRPAPSTTNSAAAPIADRPRTGTQVHTPQPVDLSQESVAGEEDPGASLEPPPQPDPQNVPG